MVTATAVAISLFIPSSFLLLRCRPLRSVVSKSVILVPFFSPTSESIPEPIIRFKIPKPRRFRPSLCTSPNLDAEPLRKLGLLIEVDGIGWPTSLPTNEKETFVKSIMREKRKALEDFARSSDLALRPGVENFIDEAIREGLPLVFLSAYSKIGDEVCRILHN